MNYEDMVKKAQEAVAVRDVEEAQALAMLAVADRLDRLCKIMSRGN